MKKVSRTFIFMSTIVTLLVVSVIGVSANAIIREVKKNSEKDAVFGLDGILYLYQDGKISTIEDQPGEHGKYGPEVSPDRTKILYRIFGLGDRFPVTNRNC